MIATILLVATPAARAQSAVASPYQQNTPLRVSGIVLASTGGASVLVALSLFVFAVGSPSFNRALQPAVPIGCAVGGVMAIGGGGVMIGTSRRPIATVSFAPWTGGGMGAVTIVF